MLWVADDAAAAILQLKGPTSGSEGAGAASSSEKALNPFASSPLSAGAEVSSRAEVEPDVAQQLTGLKSELHALLRVLG